MDFVLFQLQEPEWGQALVSGKGVWGAVSVPVSPRVVRWG